MRYEQHNLDGTGFRRTMVFDMPSVNQYDYWLSVTNVPCPSKNCNGTIRWAEAGYVPGYRICEQCGRHFLAEGNAQTPKLLRVRNRTS